MSINSARTAKNSIWVSFFSGEHDNPKKYAHTKWIHLNTPTLITENDECSQFLTDLSRSKELRESLSRPSSRLSCENGMEKMGKDVVSGFLLLVW